MRIRAPSKIPVHPTPASVKDPCCELGLRANAVALWLCFSQWQRHPLRARRAAGLDYAGPALACLRPVRIVIMKKIPFPQFHRHNRAVFLLLLSVVVRVRRGVWEGFVDGHQWNVVRLFFNIFFNIFQCGDSAICIQQRRKLPRSKTAYRTRQCD